MCSIIIINYLVVEFPSLGKMLLVCFRISVSTRATYALSVDECMARKTPRISH